MQVMDRRVPADSRAARPRTISHAGGWLILCLALTLLGATSLRELWAAWRSDPSLSHGPLLCLLAAGHLWWRRDRIGWHRCASRAGLTLLLVAGLVHIAAVWADIDFLKPLTVIGVAFGVLWFLGGPKAARAGAGSLGLLVFCIPWPTTVTERLAFPMQMLSSTYAAQFAGMLGLPVQRDGVSIAVMPHLDAPPVFAIVVAQACSGLTSMTVLLALGYMVAYHTPARFGWRALLAASVIPLALVLNTVRLTLVLLAGAHHSRAFALWVHDHEEPVLVLLCSLALLTMRQGLLGWLASRDDSQALSPLLPKTLSWSTASAKTQGLAGALALYRTRFWVVNTVLVLVVLGASAGRYQDADRPRPDFLRGLVLPFRGWETIDSPLSPADRSLLQPDAALVRRYESHHGESAELAVIAGHKKRTVHTPSYCMLGGGWEVLTERPVTLALPGGAVRATRMLMTKSGVQMMVTYFFTDGDYSTGSLLPFQEEQLLRRFRNGASMGALIRIRALVTRDPAEAARLSDAFACATVPPVLARVRAAQRQP